MSEGFQVVPPWLLFAQVSIDAHVPGRPGQRFVLSVRNVLVGVGVDVLFSQTEVNNVNVFVLQGKIKGNQ